jgi:hypothetical protein
MGPFANALGGGMPGLPEMPGMGGLGTPGAAGSGGLDLGSLGRPAPGEPDSE